MTRTGAWLTADDCRLDDLVALVEQPTDPDDHPYAAEVVDRVPVYDAEQLRPSLRNEQGRRAVQAEWAHVLEHGAGLVVLRRAYPDRAVVDRATQVFHEIIAEQRASGTAAGDHFAKPGANDRVWNALQKLAVRAPDVFAEYYANDMLELVSSAWLGPAYQLTSQVNVVNPGGQAQSPHRDYHLGFMSDAQAAGYPAHVHRLSPALTLQGAVAHTDMPVETGPTLYLPHSQKYLPGYLAFRRPELVAYVEQHVVQLPLQAGDAAFFNPALFHGAGHNRTSDVRRMANLLQVSSAFGRAMESVDRHAMALALFPELVARRAAGVPDEALRRTVAAAAEGYAFPTNLDLDQPVEGLAPESQADLLWRAVTEGWDAPALRAELQAYATRRTAG